MYSLHRCTSWKCSLEKRICFIYRRSTCIYCILGVIQAHHKFFAKITRRESSFRIPSVLLRLWSRFKLIIETDDETDSV